MGQPKQQVRQRKKNKQLSSSSSSSSSNKESTAPCSNNNNNNKKKSDEDWSWMDEQIQQSPKRKRLIMPCAIASIVVAVVLGILLRLGVVRPPPSNGEPTNSSSTNTPPILKIGGYELLQQVSHDTSAYTQGLLTVERDDGQRIFYESTGQYGDSDLRLVEIETGKVQASYPIPKQFFGEGIAHYRVHDIDVNDDDKDRSFGIIQLTWREKTAFEYTFLTGLTGPAVTNWTYQTTNTQGWGITYNPVDKVFYVTDGTIYLHVWDATTRQEIAKHPVSLTREGESMSRTVNYLNELEWDPVTQTVLANVYFQDVLLRIDPQTGFVLTMYDLSTLYPRNARDPNADVLNGIALTYDVLKAAGPYYNDTVEATDQVWVTGKYWPSMYRIRLMDSPP